MIVMVIVIMVVHDDSGDGDSGDSDSGDGDSGDDSDGDSGDGGDGDSGDGDSDDSDGDSDGYSLSIALKVSFGDPSGVFSRARRQYWALSYVAQNHSNPSQLHTSCDMRSGCVSGWSRFS